MKRLCTVLFCTLWFMCCKQVDAQNPKNIHTDKEYEKMPLWVGMMNDPNANYYETIKAFRLFWKDRVLPEEPFEDSSVDSFEQEVGLSGSVKSKAERRREERRREQFRKRNLGKEYTYDAEVRAFRGWLVHNKPWVKEDGSIYTEAERQEMINRQISELKEIESQEKTH